MAAVSVENATPVLGSRLQSVPSPSMSSICDTGYGRGRKVFCRLVTVMS